MKVRCIGFVDPINGSTVAASAWLRIGEEYVVLTLFVEANGHASVQIIGRDGSPGIWARELFETSDETLPPNWVARLEPSGVLEFGPRDWLRKGFWDDYYNDVPEALAQYERELSIILGDEPPSTVLIGHLTGEHVAIQILKRLHRDANDFWEGNWLVTSVRITAGGFTSDVRASLRAEELRAFRVALEALNSARGREAALESTEEWLSLVVTRGTSGRLTVKGKAIDRLEGGNELSFEIDDLDQNQLPDFIEALVEIEAAFPVVDD